jgi:hypothetical protein
LVWDDVFADPDNYRLLFYQELNALFYLITIKYLTPANPA